MDKIFNYKIIRQPKRKSKNIFEYAASLTICYKDKVFLTIKDVCIIDLIYQLSLYKTDFENYFYVPIDATDKVLIFKKIDKDYVKISSEWTENSIIINQEELIESIKALKTNFETDLRLKVNNFFKK